MTLKIIGNYYITVKAIVFGVADEHKMALFV